MFRASFTHRCLFQGLRGLWRSDRDVFSIRLCRPSPPLPPCAPMPAAARAAAHARAAASAAHAAAAAARAADHRRLCRRLCRRPCRPGDLSSHPAICQPKHSMPDRYRPPWRRGCQTGRAACRDLGQINLTDQSQSVQPPFSPRSSLCRPSASASQRIGLAMSAGSG